MEVFFQCAKQLKSSPASALTLLPTSALRFVSVLTRAQAVHIMCVVMVPSVLAGNLSD